MAFLEVKNLKKRFSGTEVLKGVSFSLEKGEVVSVIGSSGNGKTTLLRCLNLLEIPESGEILVDKKVAFQAEKRYNERELRKNRLHFGLVFQNFNLFPQYTALENVRLALDLQVKDSCKGESRAAQRAAYDKNEGIARDLLVAVGLGDKTGNYPCELSGGQCQRVAIARALALQPEILCFDEPTSALDPELTGEVLKVIKALKSPERSMLIVTHEMQFAAEISDKIIFMSDGVIEEYGPPRQIFTAPNSEKTKSFLRNMPIGENFYDG